MLCELFRGHKRARMEHREDGRIAATSAPYSFCRARHRRIFETMETYSTKYPEFWDWTREIYRLAKEQVTEAGLNERLVQALHRGISQGSLPGSAPTGFYDSYFIMVEKSCSGVEQDGDRERTKKLLGVRDKLGDLVCDLDNLWNTELLSACKKEGWGCEFDRKSDDLFRRVGELLNSDGCIEAEGRMFIPKEVYLFAIAYGRLSMTLPYIAYHTIGAIILTHGIAPSR